MQNFDYMTPTRLVFGENAIRKLPEAMAAHASVSVAASVSRPAAL